MLYSIFIIFLITRIIFRITCFYVDEVGMKGEGKIKVEGSYFTRALILSRLFMGNILHYLFFCPPLVYLYEHSTLFNHCVEYLRILGMDNWTLKRRITYRLPKIYKLLVENSYFRGFKMVGFFSFIIIRFINVIYPVLYVLAFLYTVTHTIILLVNLVYGVLVYREKNSILPLSDLVSVPRLLLLQIFDIVGCITKYLWAVIIYQHMLTIQFSIQHYFIF